MTPTAFFVNLAAKVLLMIVAGVLFAHAVEFRSLDVYPFMRINGVLLGLAALFAWAAFSLKFSVERDSDGVVVSKHRAVSVLGEKGRKR